jgi:hypothetical protein
MAGKAGRSGRKPVSAELHVLRNTFRADRHALAPAVVPVSAKPLLRPPRGLSAAGRRFWNEAVAGWQLETAPDLELLRLVCQAIDDARTARTEWQAEGATVVMPSGAPRPHPAIRRENEAVLRFARLLAQLNLEPTR